MKNIKLKSRTLEQVQIFWEKTQDKEIRKMFPVSVNSLSESIRLYEGSLKVNAKSFGKSININDKYIGDVWAYEIDESKDKQAFISIVIFDKTYWGKGIGKNVLKQFIQIMFKKYEIKKLCAFTYKSNESSVHLLESVGFKRIKELEENEVPSYYYELSRINKYKKEGRD